MFLPLVVEAENGIKVCLTESDLEDFPGLYLSAVEGEEYTLKGVHAPYPKTVFREGIKCCRCWYKSVSHILHG